MEDWKLADTFDFDGRPVRFGQMGEGSPVVVVHGTPWSSFNLRHIIRGLAENHRVYYYDLIGYGQSGKGPGDVSLAAQNELLSRLLAHWGLQNPLVVGHDFGGATVLRTHLLNQITFEKMVLIDPVAVSPWGSPFFRHVREHEAAFSGVPDYIHDAIVRAYVQTAAHQPIAPATLDQIVSYWTGADGKQAFYRQIAQADSKYTDQVEPLYGTISTPTLILWGEEDTWIPVEKGEQLHRMIPQSQFRRIPDAGHLVIEEESDALLRPIECFFSENA
ncbi:MAG: alpha/beta fold hydrolase [Puniceicoccales bacterium]